MTKLLLVISLIISVSSFLISILLWMRMNKLDRKRKGLIKMVIDNQNNNISYFENHGGHITKLIGEVEQIKKTLSGWQQPSLKSKASQGTKDSVPNQVNPKQDEDVNKNRQPLGIKTVFLGINSDDIFFDVEEKKCETSKFVAKLNSETEGTYEPIDVERVRSASVNASIKQFGVVPIKDAHSFRVIEPGKLRKVEGGWHIESPVVVEFIK